MATSRRRERWVSRSVCLLVCVGFGGFGVGDGRMAWGADSDRGDNAGLGEGLPADFEGGRGHGGELGVYGENAVEFSVGEGGGDVGGDAGEDPIVSSAYWKGSLNSKK